MASVSAPAGKRKAAEKIDPVPVEAAFYHENVVTDKQKDCRYNPDYGDH